LLTLAHATEEDLIDLGRRIERECRGFSSHEQVSQTIAESLYHEFRTGDEHELALVRIYRLTPVKSLPPELRAQVSDDEQYVMALTGTYGMLESWCDRRTSVNHKVISIKQIAVRSLIPMFEEVLVNGMKVDFQRLYETGDIVASTKGFAGQFYVPDVSQSPHHIPAQEEFVKPYGIQSEVGFGGLIGDGPNSVSLYTLFAFSRFPISTEAATHFFALRPHLGTALATHSGQTIFAGV
jgi:hypothetical protein